MVPRALAPHVPAASWRSPHARSARETRAPPGHPSATPPAVRSRSAAAGARLWPWWAILPRLPHAGPAPPSMTDRGAGSRLFPAAPESADEEHPCSSEPRRAISRASALRTAGLVASVVGLSACGGGSVPTAPSGIGAATVAPPATPVPPPAPSVPAVTFTVRSGAEGLPAVPGATIRVGDTSLATNAQGTVSLGGLTGPVSYLVEAPGHLSYRGIVTTPLTEVGSGRGSPE